MADLLDVFQPGLYPNGVGIQNNYTFDPGVCILPLAEDPPESEGELATWSPVVVLRLHAPYRVRKVNYDLLKQNNPPVVPSPTDAGKFVFVGGTFQVVTALNNALNKFDWECKSEYVFVEDCVSRIQDGLVLGMPPFYYTSSYENYNRYLGGGPIPTIGAISGAGTDAIVGNMQGAEAATIMSGTIGGFLGTSWNYNTISYLPGAFFNETIVNAGPGGILTSPPGVPGSPNTGGGQ